MIIIMVISNNRITIFDRFTNYVLNYLNSINER